VAAEKFPSHTAKYAAICRAAHYVIDEKPVILADSFARAFAGFGSDEALLWALRNKWIMPPSQMRALSAVRTRYAEDELAEAVKRGISQYIVLGAGLDSFAYRCPASMHEIRIFEVDHPVSNAFKRDLVVKLGIQLRRTVTYVSVNFETQCLVESLINNGIDQDAPAFISWLGVTQYLTREAIFRTLQDLREAVARGSELVVQYVAPPEATGQEEAAAIASIAARAAAFGEPWISFFAPEEFEGLLETVGFEPVVHFGAEQASARYLAHRTDGLQLPNFFSVVKARAR